MGTRRLLDAHGGVISTFEYDDTEKRVVIGTHQDVTPILEANKRLQNQGDGGYGPSRELRRVASVPFHILLKWCQDDGIKIRDYLRKPKAYSKWLRRKIYDRDNFFVLTAPHKAR